MKAPKITRDLVLFVSGLAGIFYETLVEKIDRPSLLVVFAGMMGLPVFLRRDEKSPPNGVPTAQQPTAPDPGGRNGSTGPEGG